jgi:hypothetical protein
VVFFCEDGGVDKTIERLDYKIAYYDIREADGRRAKESVGKA